jgi:thioredoxin-like negative regulator of GroEL
VFATLSLLALLSAPAPASAGAPPPTLTVLDSVDALMNLVAQQPRGPVVVHFWATWCKACVSEMPKIRKLQEAATARGLPMIGVSMDPKDKNIEVAAFIHREGLTFRNVILDAPDPVPVVRRFDPHWRAELPATFLALQSGVIVDSFLGSTPLKKIEGQLDQLLASPPTKAESAKTVGDTQ